MRFGADMSAFGLDQLLDDRKADAGPAVGSVTRLLDAIEALEDAIQIVRRDALAAVGDRDQEVRRAPLGADGDDAAGRV